MDRLELEAVLSTIPEWNGECTVEQVGERTFHARCSEDSYFIKWIKAGDLHGRNEIEINTTILPGAPIPAPRLIKVLPIGEDCLVFWEWVEGEDLRSAHREFLPQAFRQLGNFHLSQRGNGQISSPVTGNIYSSIPSFLDGESSLLCADLPPVLQNRCRNILGRLACGYPTTIHGDMHPGNLIATPDGPLFIDWGYSRRSINLLDLDYIHCMHFQPAETDWWIIQPEEAGNILAGYYSTCGMSEVNPREIQHAVMLWSILWGLYNTRKPGFQAARGTAMLKLEQIVEARS